MHRFVVLIKLYTSKRAWVPGHHFLVLFAGWWWSFPLIFFLWDGGIIWPPSLGLKNFPWAGFNTIGSGTTIYMCKYFDIFDIVHIMQNIQYCGNYKSISTVSTYFCSLGFLACGDALAEKISKQMSWPLCPSHF